MSTRFVLKLLLDGVMLLLTIVLMSSTMFSESGHEYTGMAMLLLVSCHMGLNRQKLAAMIRNPTPLLTLLRTVTTVLMMAALGTTLISGLMLSRHVPGITPLEPGPLWDYARMLHLAGAYWSMLLISIHLGLRGRMLVDIVLYLSAKLPKSRHLSSRFSLIRPYTKYASRLADILALTLALYGMYLFQHHNLNAYLLLKTHFVMYPLDLSLGGILRDYFLIMLSVMILTHYCCRLLLSCTIPVPNPQAASVSRNTTAAQKPDNEVSTTKQEDVS